MENYIFKTDRLSVRKFLPEDWHDLAEILTDSEVTYFEPYETFTEEQCVKEAEDFSKSDEFFAVVLENKVIGKIYFSKRDYGSFEIGYTFNRSFHGNGYASESVKGMIDYAFEKLGIRRVFAEINGRNEKSLNLVKRVGMREEGKLLQYLPRKENPYIFDDMYIFALLNRKE